MNFNNFTLALYLLMSLLLYDACLMRSDLIIKQIMTSGDNGGALPCTSSACATSGDGVSKEPHLSPQHYELNAIQ